MTRKRRYRQSQARPRGHVCARRQRLAGALWATLLCIAAQGLLAQGLRPLTNTTPEFKCHVKTADRGDSIIRFYSRVELPMRFSDQKTFTQAPVRDSVKANVSTVYECVRIPEQFSDPGAVALEQRLPR